MGREDCEMDQKLSGLSNSMYSGYHWSRWHISFVARLQGKLLMSPSTSRTSGNL